jgi:nucleotide-binding universal stress UspA family protein
MSWKEILALADGSPDGLARVRIAVELARAFGAHLEVQSFSLLPEFPMTEAAGALADAYGKARLEAAEAAEKAMSAIRALGPGLGEQFSAYRQDVTPGQARRLAGVFARTADLVVLGRPEDIDQSTLDSELLEGAVLSGGRPCLVVPRWHEPHAWGRRALVAWKGTPEASRAVSAAMPLLAKAETVRICVANPRGETEGEDERALGRLATHLMRHGVRVEDTVTPRSTEGAFQAIAGEAASFGADLLVMGAFGRSRLRQWVFGGVTRGMLESANIPILTAH